MLYKRACGAVMKEKGLILQPRDIATYRSALEVLQRDRNY